MAAQRFIWLSRVFGSLTSSIYFQFSIIYAPAANLRLRLLSGSGSSPWHRVSHHRLSMMEIWPSMPWTFDAGRESGPHVVGNECEAHHHIMSWSGR